MIGVDGGNAALLESGLLPHLAVGDFDSAGAEMHKRLVRMGVPIKKLPAEKDMTDTHFAVTEALKRRPGTVLLLGALGTRFDHTLANLFLLEMMEREGVRGEILNRHNRIRLLCGEDSCRVRKGRVQLPFPAASYRDGVGRDPRRVSLSPRRRRSCEGGTPWGSAMSWWPRRGRSRFDRECSSSSKAGTDPTSVGDGPALFSFHPPAIFQAHIGGFRIYISERVTVGSTTSARRGRGEILHHQTPEVSRRDDQGPVGDLQQGKVNSGVRRAKSPRGNALRYPVCRREPKCPASGVNTCDLGWTRRLGRAGRFWRARRGSWEKNGIIP